MTSGRFPLSVLGTVLAAAITGCSGDMMLEFLPPDDITQVAEDMVMVRFRNLAISEAVDVEFYATNEPLENLPDDLFDSGHLLSEEMGIGFAGTGLVPPLRQEVIEVPCSDELIIGTSGGRFVDSDTGELRGVGRPLWLKAEGLGLCGSVVMFEFSSGERDFTTTLTIGD